MQAETFDKTKLFNIRKLKNSDYFKNYLELLEQLTVVDKEKISYDDFNIFVDNLNDKQLVYVIEDNNKIVATITVLIENKLIHGLGKVGHIEDVVVDKIYSGKHIGKQIVEFAVCQCKNIGCYKVLLDCSDDVKPFYEKCNFDRKGNLMALYFS